MASARVPAGPTLLTAHGGAPLRKAFLDLKGAASPLEASPRASSDSEGEASDQSPSRPRVDAFRRFGLVVAALAGCVLLASGAAWAVQAGGLQEAGYAIDSGEASVFKHRTRHRARLHQKARSKVKHVAVHYPPSLVQIAPEQPSVCNGTRLKKGRQGCCAGKPFQLMTTACCGELPFYFSELSCCDHGDGSASLYDPYAQNCCDDAAVSNNEKGICELEPGERSCCTRMQQGHRRRRARKVRHVHAYRKPLRSLREGQEVPEGQQAQHAVAAPRDAGDAEEELHRVVR